MDNQDTLFNKIKSAAENAETKEFPGMEKVWSRLDAKLDTKIENKNNAKWKVLLAAASVVVVLSIGFQFFKTNEKVENQPNNVVKSNPEEQLITPKLLQDTTAIVNTNPIIKKDVDSVLSESISNTTAIGSTDSDAEIVYDKLDDKAPNILPNKSYNNTASASNSGSLLTGRKFNSRGVVQEDANRIGYSITVKDFKEADKKLEPLTVVNGEVYKKELSNLDDEEVDSILELPNPLYIINGAYYTEQELFGPNPTSPYSPLNKQKIETISIIQPEKAATIYGEKGKNGVVIIATKDGKPFEKK